MTANANAKKRASKASDISKSVKTPPISEPPPAIREKSGEIAGMLILGVAALAMLFVFVNDKIINPVLTGLGGVFAFTLPVIIGWFGYLTIRYGKREKNSMRVATISAMILIAFAILHLFFTARIMGSIYIPGWINFIVYSYEHGAGAGLLGALLAYPVYRTLSLGLWGGLIVLLALFGTGLVMLGAVSPREMLDMLTAKINNIWQGEKEHKPAVTFLPTKRSRESRNNDLNDIQWDNEPVTAETIIPNVLTEKKRKSAITIVPPLTSAPPQPEAEPPRVESAYEINEAFDDSEPIDNDAGDDMPFYFKQPPAPQTERALPKRVSVNKKRVKKKPDDDLLIIEPEEFQKELFEAAADKYNYPPVDILSLSASSRVANQAQRDQAKALKLEETLKSFGIAVRLSGIAHGPTVTRFELSPAPGVKVSRITALTDDIALNLEARSVRIEAPIPGKAAVGVEVPNDEAEIVSLREVLESNEARRHSSRLAVALGKDNSGKFIIADLAKMPHLLIAGATGAGKSVCINCIIASILYRASPEEVRLIMIDPKVVELSVYDGIPHLLIPVVTDPRKAAGALTWAVVEMKRRYDLFAERKVRDMKGYNMSCKPDEETLPQIVIIIDELADMMLVAPGDVEDSIMRLAQLARAAGIHLVIATQRPSVNVITGVIKANIPSRIAFTVASQVDSRTILDYGGAEKLLGRGDMLFAPSGTGKPQRVQGAWISDDEVKEVVRYIKQRHEVEYSEDLAEHIKNTPDAIEDTDDTTDDNFDDLLPQAIEIAVESGQASISMLQRRLRIGYARAGRLIDEMAARSFISQAEGSKPRDVLITREQFKLLFDKK